MIVFICKIIVLIWIIHTLYVLIRDNIRKFKIIKKGENNYIVTLGRKKLYTAYSFEEAKSWLDKNKAFYREDKDEEVYSEDYVERKRGREGE